MRAWEILGEGNSPKTIPQTLRNLNTLKHQEKARAESERQRHEFMPLMYSNTDHIKDRIEIQRQKLELMQLLMQVEKEQDAETYVAISNMAQSGIKADGVTDDKIQKLAKSGIQRKKKA